MLLEFNITEDFQYNEWSNQNLNKMNWNYETYHVDESNKFYFFRFVKINNSNTDEPRYFPCFLRARDVNLQLQDYGNYLIENKIDFINGNLIPVILDPLEGNSGNHDYVSELAKRIDFPIYFIDGNYRLSIIDKNYTHYYTNHWVHHVNNDVRYSMLPLENEHRVYINLNRVAREHRVKLMSKLIDLNLKNCGYNTWANTYNGYQMWENIYPNIMSETYDILDVEDISAANPTMEIPVDYCKKSFLYIVTETHTNIESIFLSEKSYKPMRVGLPFIILGSPGTLDLLKKLGFKTFSNWINEDYDLPLELEQRIDIIVEEINKFNNMTNIERLKIREEMNDTIAHNYKHLYKCKFNSDLIEALLDIKNRASKK